MIYEKMVSSWDNTEISDYLDLLHDDYEFVMHLTGEVSNRKNGPGFYNKIYDVNEIRKSSMHL